MALDLINNVALLLAVCWLQSLVSTFLKKNRSPYKFLSGIVFGTATIIVMMTSILIEPGLWLWTDSGMVVVSVSTLLYGPVSGGIALLCGVSYKLWMGGIVSVGAVINLLISFAGGVLFRIIVKKLKLRLGILHFLLFGLVIHSIATWQLYHFYIPLEINNVPGFYLTLLAIMGVATSLLGIQLQYIERKIKLERRVRENEKKLSLITQSIPDQLVLANGQGVLTDIYTPENVVEQISQRDDKSLKSIDDDAYEKHYAFLINRALSSTEAVIDTYSSNRPCLLGKEISQEEYHFESISKKVRGYDKDEVVILTRDITRRVKAEKEIAYLAHYDPLTNLPNSHKAILTIKDYIAKYTEIDKKFHIILLHLDNFYLFNESLGKDAGDAVLKEISRNMKEVLGNNYFLTRFSGVEFLILSENPGGPEDIVDLFKKLKLDVTITINGEKVDVRLAVSGGVARFPVDADTDQELIRKASLALENAVDTPRKVRFYDPTLDSNLNELLMLRSAMINAVKEEHLDLHYQPVFSLKDDSISGLEAVIRCENEKLNFEDQSMFLEAAEKSGLTRSMSGWMLERSCIQIKELERDHGFSGDLFVRISHFELVDSEFPFIVQSVLARTGFDPHKLYLDITETNSNKSLQNIATSIHELDKIGVRLKVNLFSKAYGALTSITNSHSSLLKVSCEEALDIYLSDPSHSVINSILQLAKSMDISTLVDGVNDEYARRMIEKVGFANAQGDAFLRPMTFDEIKTLIDPA